MGLSKPTFIAVLALTVFAFVVRSSAETKGDPQAGKAVYEEHCLKCHGEKGKGDGATAKKLKMKLLDYSSSPEVAKATDEELIKITMQGGEAVGKSKLMPPYSDKLSAKQAADVIAYVRAFAAKK